MLTRELLRGLVALGDPLGAPPMPVGHDRTRIDADDADQPVRHLAVAVDLVGQRDEHLPWYKRPATLGVVVLALTLVLNIIFW